MTLGDARARLVVLAICVLLLATVLVALGQRDRDARPLEARTAASQCKDILLVLVPGNREGVTRTGVRPGRTLQQFRDEYVRRAPWGHRTVEVHTIQFRSQPLWDLDAGRNSLPANRVVKPRHSYAWWAGVPAAIRATRSLLQARQRACPQQSIVFGGFAQGASVVHHTLAGFPASSSVIRRTVGALLISDPDRQRHTRARTFGSPAASRTSIGIERVLRRPVADVPGAGTNNRVISLCRRGDLVCDFRGQTLGSGLTVANTYFRNQAGQIYQAAADLARRSRAVAKPLPVDQDLAVMGGVPVSRQLRADTRAAFRSYLRWRPTSSMPPGLTLSSRGALTGQPTTPGTWTVRYTVANTAYPGTDRPVPGTIRLRVTANRLSVNTAGGDSTCTVRADDTMWCWGDNYEGQLGQGNRTNQLRPVRMGSGAYWRTVSTGGAHMCGIRTGGGLWCTGRNDFGQLGDGTRTRRLRPVRVLGGLTWASVSTNLSNTCGITTAGALYCWGKNDEGQVGDSTTTTRLRPVRIGAASNWAGVTVGGWHTCAYKVTGDAWCWGDNSFGQLGNGRDIAGRTYPVRIVGDLPWSRISAGAMHTCGITSAGQASCWGANTSGQLGNGTHESAFAPVRVAGDLAWQDIEVGTLSTCAVTTSNAAYCWGAGQTGVLGRDGVRATDTPQAVGSTDRFVRVSVGWAHACGTRADGATLCWGLSSAGQVGAGTHTTQRTPVRVLGG